MATIIIRYEEGDELIHTDEHPFCSDVHCPCHDIQEEQYYRLIAQPLLGGLMTPEEANRLYFGEQAQARNTTTQCSDGSWW